MAEKLNLSQMQTAPLSQKRSEAEQDMHRSTQVDGLARRRLNRTGSFLWRCSPAERKLLEDLADTAQPGMKLSFNETIVRGLHALKAQIENDGS